MENEILEMILTLQQKQKAMLQKKLKEVQELFSICPDNQTLRLVYDLILNFTEMDDEAYSLALNDISSYIINGNFKDKEIGILAMSDTKDPDSSQEVVQNLKLTLGIAKHLDIEIRNSFRYRKEFINGKKQIIIVDDFIGSGKTCRSRYKALINDFKYQGNILFCFVAGMKDAIDSLKSEGINIYCPYIMEKGISGFYKRQDEKTARISQMKCLEKQLAPQINATLLSEHSFGYGGSEALFCRRNKNIPNNTFPLFWWKEYANGDKRNTLYTRVQNGY